MPVKIPEITLPEVRTVEIPFYSTNPILQGQIPGCSFGHRDANKNRSLILGDPNGRTTSCPDGSIPSYTPMQINQSEIQLVIQQPKRQEEKQSKGKPIPIIPSEIINQNKKQKEEPCPRPDDLPLFSKNKLQTHRIVKYEKINGECKQILELLPPLQVINNYIPAPSLIVSTSVVVTSGVVAGSLAKDYLLKAIKPVIKKISKKIAAIKGKTKVLSVSERRKEQRDLKK
tara:strand:- start:465 stop:1151 length:687 start_codon:yes stop_codon:yes gene_type:complete